MLRSSLLGILCGFVLVLPARAEEKVHISGKYTVEGLNPDGGTYRGTAEIAKKGDTYTIDWLIGSAEKYKGIGIRQGDVLAVSYVSNAISGVVVYKIEKGKLVGQWAIQGGNGKIQTETLTKD